MDELRISLVQGDILWENIPANLEYYENLLKPLSGKTDLVILPETFSTGFSMNPSDVAELNDGITMQRVQFWAQNFGFAVCGSFIAENENEHGRFFNRGFFKTPEGNSRFYDKRHLFRMSEEHNRFTPGKSMEIIRYKGWNIRMIICYDLRFPVWIRNRNNEYDLLICAANWPSARAKVWKTLLKARAIENLCYVAGVNRIGTDIHTINHRGDSLLIDYKGKIKQKSEQDKESVVTAAISKKSLEDFRIKFPVWMDSDDFSLQIR